LCGRRLALGFAVGCCALVTGCGSGIPAADNAAFLAALHEGRPAEVTVRGHVVAVRADFTGFHGPHQRFTVDVSEVNVEVDHNLTLAPRVPLHAGDEVTIHGQFEPDPGRPVIHDTHHSTTHHEGGWIDLHGHRYE